MALRIHPNSRIRKEKWGEEVIEMLTNFEKVVNGVKITFEYIQETIKAKYKEEIPIRTLRYYRDKYVLPTEKIPNAEVTASLLRRGKLIDIAAERSTLYVKQMQRIEAEREIEKKMGKLLPTLNKEITVANDVLTELKNDYFELGLKTKVPDKIEHKSDVGASFLEAVNKYKKFKEEEKKRKKELEADESQERTSRDSEDTGQQPPESDAKSVEQQ